MLATGVAAALLSVQKHPSVAASVVAPSPLLSSSSRPTTTSRTTTSLTRVLRAGASADTSKKKLAQKKKKKKKKAKRKATTSSKPKQSDEKAQVEKVLKEKDASEALGDAIRERADQLRYETSNNPLLVEGIQNSVSSVGWAMGASDHHPTTKRTATTTTAQQQQEEDDDEGGGVEAAPTAVLVHYFLKSHGGAHALQCVCSLLATTAGLGVILLPFTLSKKNSKWHVLSLTLIKRCMLFAMVKHVSGLLAATFLTARAIPEVGLRKARAWMDELVTDPVSQYVFYAACILLWLPNPNLIKAASTSTDAATTASAALWWQSYPVVPPLLVGPVVLREMVSTALVVSDVLVLWNFSTGKKSTLGQVILKTGQTCTDAMMSILVTPSVWRTANAAERQAILAKLTSKLTLAMEVAVGLLMTIDSAWSLIGFTFASLSQRLPVLHLLKRLFCTRLYLHFLWTRRRKIERLATSVRGGASQLPFYVLNVLMYPVASMGLDDQERCGVTKLRSSTDSEDDQRTSSLTWKDYLMIGLGLDSDADSR